MKYHAHKTPESTDDQDIVTQIDLSCTVKDLPERLGGRLTQWQVQHFIRERKVNGLLSSGAYFKLGHKGRFNIPKLVAWLNGETT